MTLNITFPTEIENAIRARAAAAGIDIESFVTSVVYEEVAEDVQPKRPRKISPDERARRAEAWVKLHPALDHAVDDSRESIYAGRGER